VTALRLVDSHGHLQDPAFDADREAVYERAASRGIGVVIPGYTVESSEQAVALAHHWPLAWAQVGVHPHEVADVPVDWLDRLEALAGAERVVAIGEIGLDYYRDLSPRVRQQEAFLAQLELARRLQLPVAVHSRDALADTLACLKAVPGTIGVLHCFTGDKAMAAQLLDLGFYLSFAGPVTFRSGEPLREVVKWAPWDRVLVETDAPYMAPVPHRGHRNEPSWVEDTARQVVALGGRDQEAGFLSLVSNTMQAFARIGAQTHDSEEGVDGSTNNC